MSITKEHRGPGTPYYCDADREYWKQRKETFVLPKKVVLVKKPTYLSHQSQADIGNVWQFDMRETTADRSEWEYSCITPAQTGASLKRIRGEHALDWCSTVGISSYMLLNNHTRVTTIECRPETATLARTNLKAIFKQNNIDSNRHTLVELQCNVHTSHIKAMNIDWTVYDTVRLGSNSAENIYMSIRSQLTNCKQVIVPSLTVNLKAQLLSDGYKFIENFKAADYFAK
jgi:hypothetical protein